MEFLQDLEKRVDQDWDSISSSLEEIRRSFLKKEGCLFNMTADGKNLTKSTFYIAKFLDSLPRGSSGQRNNFLDQLPPVNEAIVVPTQVTPFIGYLLRSEEHIVPEFLFLFYLTEYLFMCYIFRSTM